MSGHIGHRTRIPPPAIYQHRTVGSNNERTTRQYARGFSRTSSTNNDPLPGCSTLRGPDVNKDLPRIPSTSAGPWDAESIMASSDTVASLEPSPALSHPLLPASRNLTLMATTEAQKIAARYRRRRGSLEALRSEVIRLPQLEVSFCLNYYIPLVPPGCRH